MPRGSRIHSYCSDPVVPRFAHSEALIIFDGHSALSISAESRWLKTNQ